MSLTFDQIREDATAAIIAKQSGNDDEALRLLKRIESTARRIGEDIRSRAMSKS